MERFTAKSKELLVELLLSKVVYRDYLGAVRYVAEFCCSQDLVPLEEAASYVAAAHGKEPEEVLKDISHRGVVIS